MTIEQTDLQPTISSDRFVLRPLRVSDQGLISLYAGDKRVACMTGEIAHPYPPGAAEAYIARAHAPDRTEDIWAIDGQLSDAPELMGVIALKRMDRNQSEIAYWVAPGFWNTGLASDAVRVLVETNPLGNATMFATVFQDNAASARVLTNCGFDYIGDAEQFCIARGATVPTWTYLKQLS
ncbi:GNAT family N-acetyltransferase [Roseivivax sp. CAU 1753]